MGEARGPSVGHWQREVEKLRAALGICWSWTLASMGPQPPDSCQGLAEGTAPVTQRWAEGSCTEVRDVGLERWGRGVKGESGKEWDRQRGHRDLPADTACGEPRQEDQVSGQPWLQSK